MQHKPPSANTSAPASNCHSEPSYSLNTSYDTVTMTTVTLTAVTVSPALVEPTPLVMTDRGISFAENFKNCDLAVPTCNNNPQCVTVTVYGGDYSYLGHLLTASETLLSHDHHLMLSSIMSNKSPWLHTSHAHLNSTNQNKENRKFNGIQPEHLWTHTGYNIITTFQFIVL